ncbi:hypothetical protein [Citricoccus sp. GCM10030269]|uniref:hypothetical protein n=1 Tax=Citricoccus sp. GCM10030269 TaxID=3273388 RepID=UPI00360A4E51
MQTGSDGGSSLVKDWIEVPFAEPGGPPVEVPVPVVDAEVLCSSSAVAAVAAVDTITPDEALLRLLETAVVQLQQVVEELRLVGSGTRSVAESIHSLSGMEWRSPAGELFLTRSQMLHVRAADLADTAEESAALARASIEDLHHRIGTLRASIQAAKAALTATALGMC